MSDMSGMESDAMPKIPTEEQRQQRRLSLRERFARQQSNQQQLNDSEGLESHGNQQQQLGLNSATEEFGSTTDWSANVMASIGGNMAPGPPRRERSGQSATNGGNSISSLDTRRKPTSPIEFSLGFIGSNIHETTTPTALTPTSSTYAPQEAPFPPGTSYDEAQRGMSGLSMSSRPARKERTVSLAFPQQNQAQLPPPPMPTQGFQQNFVASSSSGRYPDTIASSPGGSLEQQQYSQQFYGQALQPPQRPATQNQQNQYQFPAMAPQHQHHQQFPQQHQNHHFQHQPQQQQQQEFTFPSQQYAESINSDDPAVSIAESTGSDQNVYKGFGEVRSGETNPKTSAGAAAQKIKKKKQQQQQHQGEEVTSQEKIFFGPPTKLNYVRRKSETPQLPKEDKKSSGEEQQTSQKPGLFGKLSRSFSNKRSVRSNSPSSVLENSSVDGVPVTPEHQQQSFYTPTEGPAGVVPSAAPSPAQAQVPMPIRHVAAPPSNGVDGAVVHPFLAEAATVVFDSAPGVGLQRSKSFSSSIGGRRVSTAGSGVGAGNGDEEGEEGESGLAKFRARRAAEKARLAMQREAAAGGY